MAAARYDLGVEPSIYLEMTVRAAAAMWDRWAAEQNRVERRWANWFAMFAEAHRDHDKRSEPFTPAEFLAGEADTPAAPRIGQQTAEDQMAIMTSLSVAWSAVRKAQGGNRGERPQ